MDKKGPECDIVLLVLLLVLREFTVSTTTQRGHYINSHQPLPGFSDVRSLFFWKTYCEELKCKMASEWRRLKRHWIYNPEICNDYRDNAQTLKLASQPVQDWFCSASHVSLFGAWICRMFLPTLGFNQLMMSQGNRLWRSLWPSSWRTRSWNTSVDFGGVRNGEGDARMGGRCRQRDVHPTNHAMIPCIAPCIS